MESIQSLHDFVLTMLSDPTTLTSFAADPEGTLSAAGLGDINASDVHDVMPLVIDYAPTHLVDALQSVQNALSGDGLDLGHAGAINQLQVLTQAVGSVTSSNPLTAGGDFLHQGVSGLTNLGTVGNLGGVSGVVGGLTNSTDLGNLGNASGTVGNLAANLTSAGDVSNVGALGTVEHIADLDGLNNVGDLSNLGSQSLNGFNSLGNVGGIGNGAGLGGIGNGSIGNIGSGDLGHLGSGALSHTSLDHIGDLGHVGNLVNVGNVGNLVNIDGNSVGNTGSSDLLGHNAVTNLVPSDLHSTVTNVTSHLSSGTDVLHSVLPSDGSGDLGSLASHSPLADSVSGSPLGDTSAVHGDVTGLVHDIAPTDALHPLF